LTLAAGSRLGPYEILAPLGAGGMGEVWRARDTRLERTVAIKVLPQHLSASPEVRQRFEREAKTISQLSHPHICALYDVGREGDVEYLVMEYLEGETLSERLAKGALTLEQTLRYGMDIAEALDKAHRQGIVHRDLKPGNMMLTKSGVKLLDFGLAKAMAPVESKSGLTSLPTVAGSPNLTQEGTILGTFQYMAPEQLEGKETDGRTDIFALGAVLYEMATGRKAFSGTSQASLISSIMKEDPAPISSIQPMAPPTLDRVVKTCLAKDPEDRWQSAGDVGKELKWVGEGSVAAAATVPTVVASRLRGERLLLWASLLVAVGALVFSVLRRQSSAPPRRIRFTIPLPEGTVFGSYADAGTLALSPDARHLAFTAVRPGGRSSLWIRDLETLVPRALAGTEGAELPFWSPDSRSVAFFAGGVLKRMDVSGGPPQTICDAPSPYGGSWNSEGVIVFSPDSNRPLLRVAAAGGTPVAATNLVPGELGHYWPSFLPDGRHCLLLVESEKGSPDIQVATLGKAERVHVAAAESGASYAAPGFLLFVRERALTAQRFDSKSLRLQGDPTPIAEHVGRMGGAGPTRYAPFSTSANGVLAHGVAAAISSQIGWFDRQGKSVGTVGSAGDYADPELSADGKRLAVCRDDPRTGTPDIWILDTSRGTFSRLTFHPRWEVYPVWSPDASRLAFSWDKEGNNEIYLKPAGGGPEERIWKDPRSGYPLDWSSDGRFLIIAVSDPKTRSDLWMLPLEGSRTPKPLLQTPFNESEARVSPDGRFLAYTSDESGRPEVYVQPFPSLSDKWQVSSQGGTKARWRRDGKELFYLADDGMLMSVDLKTGSFDASVPRPLFQTRTPRVDFPGFHSLYDVTPDGQRFLVVSEPEGRSSPPITIVLDWTAGLKL